MSILHSKYLPFSLEHPPCLEQRQRSVKFMRAAHRRYLGGQGLGCQSGYGICGSNVLSQTSILCVNVI